MKYAISYYHNEIELIRTANPELKNIIEKAFLKNRISFFIRWDKQGFFKRLFGGKAEEFCRICINDWDKEKALEILKDYDGLIASQGELLLKKTDPCFTDIYVHR